MARLVGGVGCSHRPGGGRRRRQGHHRRALLGAVLRQAGPRPPVDGRRGARRVHRRLQRPCVGVRARGHPHFALPGRRVPPGRRGLRPPPRPARGGASRPGLAPGRVAHPRRVRPDAGQRDAGRSRAHRAAVGHVRDPEAWPCRVVPLLVNVVQYLPPTGRRCRQRPGHPPGGQSTRRRAGGGRARAACRTSSRPSAPGSSTSSSTSPSSTGWWPTPSWPRAIPHVEYRAGPRCIELVMWLVMRGALPAGVRAGLPRHPRPDLQHPQRSARPRAQLSRTLRGRATGDPDRGRRRGAAAGAVPPRRVQHHHAGAARPARRGVGRRGATRASRWC